MKYKMKKINDKLRKKVRELTKKLILRRENLILL